MMLAEAGCVFVGVILYISDFVPSTCFSVTHNKGRMCFNKQTACSITYPREVQVQRNSASPTCTTSCPVTDSKPAYRLDQKSETHSKRQQVSKNRSAKSFSCAVEGLEDVLSADFCLRVRVHPADVTEGQTVTLRSITSCPLPLNTTYIWHLNSQPLAAPGKHNITMIIPQVSSRHAGNYSCAIKGGIKSDEKTLTVKMIKGKQKSAAVDTSVTVLLLIILLIVVFFWFRKKRTSGQSPNTDAVDNTEQVTLGNFNKALAQHE